MKFRTSMICVVFLVSGLQLYGQQAGRGSNDLPRSDDSATFITFVVPGSVCEASFPKCTTPVAINPAGTVTGFYADANAARHGFLRAGDGTITAFDVPGATCTRHSSECTSPAAINPAGAITGSYCDGITCHSFLRDGDGTITTFDPPGSRLTFLSSGGSGINPAGIITGPYYDLHFVAHGFLRASDGTFTTFDAPGDVHGTVPGGINSAGAITGNYFDASFTSHGFLRDQDGTITTFDPEGSQYTKVTAINPAGAITGSYQDTSLVTHGFLRARDGTFTSFDVPGSMFQTNPDAINPDGTITGNYQEAGGLHGFIRANDGTFTTFDPPGSNEPGSLTVANGINPAGVVTGWYIDPSFLGYGFLRIPH
jgi:hypothetical protein